jgi:hypothetical protein
MLGTVERPNREEEPMRILVVEDEGLSHSPGAS